MPIKERFYIQHKWNQRFLTNLDLQNICNSTITPNEYSPNITHYPMNFRSLISAQDHLTNTLVYLIRSSYTEIPYHILTELQNYSFVKTYDGDFAPNSYFEQMANPYKDNPEQYLRKAAYKLLSYKIFNPGIGMAYESRTNFDERQLGVDPNYKDEYYVDAKFQMYSQNFDLNQIVSKLGLQQEWFASMLILPNVEDLNFLRLSCKEMSELRVHNSKELLDLECQIAHSHFSIKL